MSTAPFLFKDELHCHTNRWTHGGDGNRQCPTCKGTGINPVWPTKVCPKCDGERVIRA